MTNNSRWIALLGLCAAMAASANTAYPERPITLVVAYPAGGSTDTVARKWGEELGRQLGQPVVIENLGGAGGMIGARKVAQAPADGYTLLLGAVNEVVLSPLTNKSAPYRTADFKPVGIVGASPVVLLTGMGKPYRSLKDIAASGASGKARLSYGTPGRGTFQHIVMHALATRLKTDLLHIPYKGGAPFVTDLMGGQIDLILLPTVTALPNIAGDKMRALAVSSLLRLESAPALPTFAESLPALRDFDFSIWAGLFAPRGTPAPIVERLNKALRDAHQSESVQAFIRASGMATPPFGLSVDGAQRYLEADERKYRAIVPRMNLDE
ncbi:tripartite tricarboxylate transporter substrate binding protein [uncultured Hydrogenophaga sp.]|jgi:tripartite-type tricarboxylate transporter receptor subunit TctC|uniref:tripartite tricarboxylate transporter substrate binding protein n=1 Tax=uncultured Hydrogenophaga sp. TaxID=199683 RepID=UPI00258A8675|nr:tripartite tricarboxylate transporter substrate binding protein [uncultured Hydrogenophaga sp.]